jgi:DCN1-like protein 4/5
MVVWFWGCLSLSLFSLPLLLSLSFSLYHVSKAAVTTGGGQSTKKGEATAAMGNKMSAPCGGKSSTRTESPTPNIPAPSSNTGGTAPAPSSSPALNTQPERAPPPESSVTASTPQPSKTASAVSELCTKYYDLDEDCVGVDGIMSLCDDLGIDPSTDVTILQIAWKFKQSKPLQFTRQEFEEGMSAVGADSIASLKAALPGIKDELTTQSKSSTFKDFYKFTFQASREGTNKTIEKEVAIALLGMVMCGRKLFHIHEIAEFLTGHRKKNITADEWINFLEFGLQIKDDLSNYDEDGAWAVLVDDYVEWVKNGKKHE